MKELIVLGIFGVSVLSASVYAWGRWNTNNFNRSYNTSYTTVTTTTSLTDIEEEALVKLRQEEKLARDVYLTLYDKYGLSVFSNIANSEQRHTDRVKYLLDKYGVEDPVTDDTVGVFKDAVFTDLYNQFVEQGSQSVVDALKVGATIEDLDIGDLEEELSITDNTDLQRVFKSLDRGSYNHLRAFVSSLQSYGETYTPQYISQEEFDSIIASSNTRGGRGMGHGRGHGRGRW